ncbi:MAG TPA: hypothetical protein VJM33_00915 [Microthrixaceae bacterium]|nr:hypothetical protein [Microthrixaceae bacterium]
MDLMVRTENEPGALAAVAAAISDAGLNLAAATYTGGGPSAELHLLVKHAGPTRDALARAGIDVATEREVVVVDADDKPGVLTDLTRRIAAGGVNLDLVYVATGTRLVFGAQDLDALRAALGVASADVEADG